jgi:RNA polymerase sigma-70 factor (sigma-E family)
MSADRAGDDFAAFAAAVSSRLLGAALLMTGDLGVAEDLVQETLLKVYRAWPRIRERDAAPSYAHRTLTRLAYRHAARWRLWRAGLSVEVPDVVAPVTASFELRAVVRDALRTVPPRQRQALVLRFYIGLSVAETAQAMQCAEGTVKSQTAAGLRHLGAALSSADAPVLSESRRKD